MATVNNGLTLTGNGSGNFLLYEPGTNYTTTTVSVSAEITFNSEGSNGRLGLTAYNNNTASTDESFLAVMRRGRAAPATGTPNSMELLDESVGWGNGTGANVFSDGPKYWLQETWVPPTPAAAPWARSKERCGRSRTARLRRARYSPPSRQLILPTPLPLPLAASWAFTHDRRHHDGELRPGAKQRLAVDHRRGRRPRDGGPPPDDPLTVAPTRSST